MTPKLALAALCVSTSCSAVSRDFEIELPLSRTPPSVEDTRVPPAPVALPKPLGTVSDRLANGLRARVVERPGSGLIDLVFVNPRARLSAEYLPVFLGDALLAGVDPGDGSLRYPASLDGQSPTVMTSSIGTLVTLTCRAERFDAALELLESTVRRPRFEPALLEPIRARTALDILSAGSQYWSWELASAHQGTFFRVDPQSVADELRNVDTAALRTAHNRLFGPSDASLVIVGDVSATRAARSVAQRFGAWREWTPAPAPPPTLADRHPTPRKRAAERAGQNPPPVDAPAVEAPASPRNVIVVKDTSYPYISLIHDAPALVGPDALAFALLLQVLNAGNSPLLQRLRYERPHVYSVRLNVITVPEHGRYVFLRTQAAERTLHGDLSLLLDELARLGSEPLSEEELAGAKARHAAELSSRLSSGSGIAWYLAMQALAEAPPLDDLGGRMKAVSAEDLRRVARLYLTPERTTIVVQGALSDSVVASLAKFGRVSTR